MRKLDPTKIALARKRRAEGRSRDEIAAELGVSAGSVSNAWRGAPVAPAAPPPPATPPPPPREPPGDAAPITRAELRVVLANHLRDLQTEIDTADAIGDSARAATTRRMLTTLVPALARVTPEDPDEAGDTVRVSVAELRAEGDALRAKLHDLVTRAVERVNVNKESGP